MTFIHIKKQAQANGEDVFIVPAMALQSPEGKKLIPNPGGSEMCMFNTLEEAQSAVRRAGFDFIYEGKKTYTMNEGYKPRVNVTDNNALQQAVPLLVERLNDKEPSVLANTAFALGALNDEAAVEPLSSLLGHDDPTVRRNVAEAMAKMGYMSIPTLKRCYETALKSKEKHAGYTRLTVMQAYLEMTHSHRELLDQVLPQAVEALQDDNWLVRAQAALVVGHSAEYLKEE